MCRMLPGKENSAMKVLELQRPDLEDIIYGAAFPGSGGEDQPSGGRGHFPATLWRHDSVLSS